MDGENRGEHHRAVVRALRSLEPLTGPTAAERQRIRDQILLSLETEPGEADVPGPTRTRRPNAGTTDEQTLSAAHEPTAAAESIAAADGDAVAVLDVVPEQRGRTKPADRPAPSPRGRKPGTREQKSGRREQGARPPGREAGPDSGDSRPAGRESRRRGVLAGARGRLAVAALALLALAGSLLGMSVLLARDALPGDALYGIKRTAEAASLGLTFGDEPKALKHLEFAAARIGEIETLARRYPNPSDAPVGLYLTALTDFDNDATAGSRQLITLATRSDGRVLESLRDWSAQQSSRLLHVAPQLPEAARNRQAVSRVLLDRITTRADALLARINCYQITSGSFDDIGALPATGQCDEKPAATSGTPQPSVPGTPDNSGSPTGPAVPSTPLPNAPPTPGVPPVPVPGATVSVPAPTDLPATPAVPTTEAPPLIELPPLLPGLPGIGIG